MTARTVITTFYGIDTKIHNDPYIALLDGSSEEIAKILTGLPGLVVRVSLRVCLYLHLSLSVLSL
jgi:hypothetical protein